MHRRTPSERRLLKELHSFVKDPPHGIFIDADQIAENLKIWIINMQGAEGTLYDGDRFQLQFKFDTERYPFEPPEVTFVGQNIPVHPHVYSNGHICLSILSDEEYCWAPALNVQSVCVSIMSMLSSCKKKERPVDDSDYVQKGSKNPKESNWYFYNEDI